MKNLQEYMQSRQKLNALYFLSSKLLHNLNNVLMLLDVTASLMKSTPGSECANHSKSVEYACEELKEFGSILSNMESKNTSQLELSDDEHEVSTKQSVLETVNTVLEEFTTTFLCDVQADLNDDFLVNAKVADIQNSLINLLINAYEAQEGLPEPERIIKLVVEKIEINQKQALCDVDGSVISGAFVKMTIIDNGKGANSDLDKLHLMHYTIKANPSSLDGLGLSLVNSIMKKNQGYLVLENCVSNGLRAMLFFPYPL